MQGPHVGRKSPEQDLGEFFCKELAGGHTESQAVGGGRAERPSSFPFPWQKKEAAFSLSPAQFTLWLWAQARSRGWQVPTSLYWLLWAFNTQPLCLGLCDDRLVLADDLTFGHSSAMEPQENE